MCCCLGALAAGVTGGSKCRLRFFFFFEFSFFSRLSFGVIKWMNFVCLLVSFKLCACLTYDQKCD